ncbi:hypothetical protein F5144DRAFT_555008 [Chaetomium tenue]|uniref:Uncharacterized protein n=1 Tax=Chaetomium tenue TaxID=1854479 RepID=A0ACB7PLP8_9PEZI|nr:hypothetical protein F5144DRAFT_555008 [Chaetomium globosum]
MLPRVERCTERRHGLSLWLHLASSLIHPWRRSNKRMLVPLRVSNNKDAATGSTRHLQPEQESEADHHEICYFHMFIFAQAVLEWREGWIIRLLRGALYGVLYVLNSSERLLF